MSYSLKGITQASTDEEMKYFRLIGDEANADGLKTFLDGLGDKKVFRNFCSITHSQSHFLNGLVNFEGMTGVHYAVLFDSQECLKVLLEVTKLFTTRTYFV